MLKINKSILLIQYIDFMSTVKIIPVDIEQFQSLKLGETCIIHEKTVETIRSDRLQSITLFHEGQAQKFTKFSTSFIVIA